MNLTPNPSLLTSFTIVLHEPRDVRNIGAVVRALKNMGFIHLRLVAPVPFDPDDIMGIAHRSDDIIATLQIYDSLDAALADATYVVGTTARAHGEHTVRNDVQLLAGELVQRTTSGPVALLFGSEDNGLTNAALDRCHAVLSLPCDPAYPSLNLAQAVLLVLYELRAAAHKPVPSSPVAQPATAAEYETLFGLTEQLLRTIGFIKVNPTPTMRMLRALAYRAEPEQAEIALLIAVVRKMGLFLKRKGIDEG